MKGKEILFEILLFLVVLAGVLARIYGPSSIVKSLGGYISLVATIYLLATLFASASRRMKVSKELEIQYFVGIISGLVSGSMILLVDRLFSGVSDSDSVSSFLLLFPAVGMVLLFTFFGLVAIGSYVQNRE